MSKLDLLVIGLRGLQESLDGLVSTYSEIIVEFLRMESPSCSRLERASTPRHLAVYDSKIPPVSDLIC